MGSPAAAPVTPLTLGLEDLIEFLRGPFAMEDLATAAVPVVVAELPTAWGGIDPDRSADAVELLQSVRCVTIAVVDGPVPPAFAGIVERFDVVLGAAESRADAAAVGASVVPTADHQADIGAIATATAANPEAAVALVQLLRQRAYPSVPNGLVLESLTYSMLQSGSEFGAWLHQRGPTSLAPDPEPPVLAERHGGALVITLNRPHRANAITASLRDHLVEHLRVAAADPSIDGVILRGNGGSFCSGGDLSEFGSFVDPADSHATRLARSPAWWIHRQARNVRAHLHGACIGGGIETPAYAGTVIAAADTRIRLPEVALGLVPGAGGTVSLPRRIGPHRTAWLGLTGAEIDAATALAWGLVDRIEG